MTPAPPPEHATGAGLVRPARPEDVPALVAMVHDLARYEREPDAVVNDVAAMTGALFGPAPAVFALVAEGDGPGGLDGMAVWFVTYSTWTGRHGIWLEDLWVRPEARRRGLARALMARLAAEACARGWARLDWSVLDWNEPARAFYRSLDAGELDEWTTHRLDGAALARLASLDRP